MKEENIVIIDNYKDLNLDTYLKVCELSRDESLSDIDREVKVISLLTGKSEKEILNLPIPTFRQLSVKASFLWREIPTEGRLAESYKVGGFDLVPVMDMRNITTSQYIDFQDLHKAGFEEHFVEILSCILVPRGMKYLQDDYDLLKVQDAIRQDMSVYDGSLIYAFFLVSCKELTRDILIYSLQEIETMKDQKMKEILQKEIRTQMELLRRNGDGSQM